MRKKLLNIVRYFMWRLFGLNELRENVDALFYFLNCFHDPSEIKIATDPDLRILHQCNIQLLRIVSCECNRLHLDYWLDFGTLLGAVRHQGIIPWDDDMDISMPRSDYNKALVELKQNLSQYGIDLVEDDRQIGIGYRHEETGIWLDIFAKDDYFCDRGDETDFNQLDIKINKCRNYYFKHVQNSTLDFRAECRSKKIGGESGNVRLMYLMPEFQYSKNVIHSSELIYPLSTVQLGGYKFNSPNNVHQYLRVIYGDNYMGFPRNGILHHDLGRGPLASWARKSGVDMTEVYYKLKSIAVSVQK